MAECQGGFGAQQNSQLYKRTTQPKINRITSAKYIKEKMPV